MPCFFYILFEDLVSQYLFTGLRTLVTSNRLLIIYIKLNITYLIMLFAPILI